MRQRIGSLVLSVMAFFSAAHLTAQVSLSTGNAEELADQLRQQGWHDVAPGVLQRQLGNQTETISIGQEGQGYVIQELRQRVATALTAYRKNPSAELKHALGSLKNQLTQIEEKMVAALESEPAAAAPLPPGCEDDFLSCSTNAYPLGPIVGLNGVGAKASATYSDTNNDCAVEGQTYVYADAYVNDWDLSDYQNDADASSPARPTVHTSAEMNLPGEPNWFSSATSSVWLPYLVSINCSTSYPPPVPGR
jgi:hypothetical protein